MGLLLHLEATKKAIIFLAHGFIWDQEKNKRVCKGICDKE